MKKPNFKSFFKKNVAVKMGTLLGCLVYLALLSSSLSTDLDLMIHSLYKRLLVVSDDGLTLWKWLLGGAGVISIAVSCFVFSTSLSKWKKTLLISGLSLSIILWSPVLAVWGIIWSPFVLVSTLLWSLLCVYIIKMFFSHVEPPNSKLEVKEEASGLEIIEPPTMTHSSVM